MKCNEIINFGMRLLFAKATKRRVPFQVYIRTIEGCNQCCSYCVDDYSREGVKAPTTKQLLDIIDSFACLGTKRITLLGGEPLLRDDIGDIVRQVKYHKINCSLTTNGKLIDRHIKWLSDLDLLSVSIDDSKISHDAYRGEGSYDAALYAVKVARRLGVPVQLLCTVTRLTDPKLENLITIAEQYNCSATFDLVKSFSNPDGTVTLRPEDGGSGMMKILLDWQIKHKNSRIVHNQYSLKYVRNWPFPYTTFRLLRKQITVDFRPIWCYAGRFSCFIEPNGDLLPCCVVRPDYSPVNVFGLGVKEAWQRMPRNDCVTCRHIGNNTLNAIFAFHPSSLFHILRIEIRGKKQQVDHKKKYYQA